MLSPVATVTVKGTTNGASGNQSMAATPMVSGGHALAVPPPGSTAGPIGRDDADTPQVLYTGLEPPCLKATGKQVTGAGTPKHRIKNKRRRRALLASQQPHMQWRIYQGEFNLPNPVAPLESLGQNVPSGLGTSSPRCQHPQRMGNVWMPDSNRQAMDARGHAIRDREGPSPLSSLG